MREPKSGEELQKALLLGEQKLKEAEARGKALEAELAATQRILQADYIFNRKQIIHIYTYLLLLI